MSIKIAGVGGRAPILMHNVTKIAGVGGRAPILMHNVTKIAGVGGRAVILMQNVTKASRLAKSKLLRSGGLPSLLIAAVYARNQGIKREKAA
ncbi:hypothetical protein [Paenibacillus antibioticophila]|uniref:hypothetical protein n=1 Tax=Paenibacillus antibioticophila TaxID=1274374 RepID=UPI0005CA1C20|nr:hypothetical protein [Paenibacillus antibioticophila]